MAKKSAGLLMFRRARGRLEVLLVHPGGPFWARKDLGAWTIPKGEYDETEDSLAAATREFVEETGFDVREPLLPLGSLKQPSGKIVSAWAFEADCDPTKLVSNVFQMEWPPRSGTKSSFPEIDRAEWFDIAIASKKILRGQAGFLRALVDLLTSRPQQVT